MAPTHANASASASEPMIQPKRRIFVGDPKTNDVKIGRNYTTAIPNTNVEASKVAAKIETSENVAKGSSSNGKLPLVPTATRDSFLDTGIMPFPPAPGRATMTPSPNTIGIAPFPSPRLPTPITMDNIGIAPFPKPISPAVANTPSSDRPSSWTAEYFKSDKSTYNPSSADSQGRDIRTMSQEERMDLIPGDGIQIFIGKDWVCTIPWQLFRVMSSRAQEIEDSLHLVLTLPAGLGKKGILYFHGWLQRMATSPRYTNLRRRNNLGEDIGVCRAARLLGMMEFVQHTFNYYWAHFNNEVPTYEEISVVEKMATTAERLGLRDDDALAFLSCIARRLGHMVYNKELADPKGMMEFLVQHPKTEDAVAIAVQQLKRGRYRP